MVDRKSDKAVRVVVMEEDSCCFKLFVVCDASLLLLVAKRVERLVVTGTGATPLDAWNACEKGSDRAMMMVVVKEADLMVFDF